MTYKTEILLLGKIFVIILTKSLKTEMMNFHPRLPDSLRGIMYNMLKKSLRILVGLLIAFPFVLSTWFLSIFIGKKRSVEYVGPFLTKLAKFLVAISVPNIETPEEFELFKFRLKRRFSFWKPLYDISYIHEDTDSLKLNILNCPFCELFQKFGIMELGKYACEGDLAVALDNSEKWGFIRTTEIGTGGQYCDNTYCRKK